MTFSHLFRWLGAACLACFLAAASGAWAVPYNGETPFTYFQPDGSTFQVRLYGNQFFAYERTLDGQQVVRDPQTGFWCYARLSADGTGFESTGVPVVAADAPSQAANRTRAAAAGIATAGQELPAGVVRALVDAARTKFGVDEQGRRVRPAEQATAAGGAGADAADAALPSPPSSATTGSYRGLCILVDFPDQAGTITQAQIDNFCNQPTGFTQFGNACSVREYYRIQSNGKLDFGNIVTAYVRMPKAKTYYDDGQPTGSKARELVSTALDLLMAQGFDFTLLSCNSSGYIKSINVFYAGTCSSGWAKGLWPHSWSIPTKVVDAGKGIRASDYQMSDLKTGPTIGTFCHENGHMTCDFPDFYSYVNGAYIIGYYSLMSGGSWGGGNGSHPNSVDPYLKMKAGWADVVEIDSTTHIRATLQADRNFFYKYTNPANSREYFLIENRNNTGYEGSYGGSGSVAPGRGIVVWQVYEWGSNTYSSLQSSPQTYVTPYEAFIVEASPSTTDTPWYNAKSPSLTSADTFYSAQGANPLSDSTFPELHFWDHSTNLGRTVPSGLVLHSFGTQGNSISFTIGTGAVATDPTLGLTLPSIAANCDLGANAASQVFQVSNTGGGTVNFTVTDDAAWLSCSPASGSASTGSQAVTASFATSGLATGQYTATITVADPNATNSPQTIPVTLNVAAAPVLSVSPSTVSLTLVSGQSSNTRTVGISNTGGGTMSYTVTKNAAWLTPSLTAGTCSTETDLSYLTISAAGLTGGLYTDTLTVTAPGAVNSPRTVAVNLTVLDGLALTAPVGGETWLTTTTQTIRWNANVTTTVTLSLLKAGTPVRTIAAATPNDGAYDWFVPGSVTPGTDYRVCVATVDGLYSSTSPADFTIAVPVVVNYTVTFQTDGTAGASLQGNLSQTVASGGSCTAVTAVAPANWHFVNWTQGNSSYSSGNPLTVSPVAQSMTLVAHFAIDTFTLGYSAGPNGTLIGATQQRVNFGASGTTVTAVANTGYHFVDWSDGLTANPRRDTNVTASRTVTANFAIDQYTLSYTAGANGTITGVALQTVNRNASGTTVTAVANTGYHFVDWSDGLTANPRRDTNITANIAVAANLTRNQYIAHFMTDGTPGASLTGTLTQTVFHGGDCTPVQATVPADYVFQQWNRNGVLYSTSNPLTVTGVAASATYTAVYRSTLAPAAARDWPLYR